MKILILLALVFSGFNSALAFDVSKLPPIEGNFSALAYISNSWGKTVPQSHCPKSVSVGELINDQYMVSTSSPDVYPMVITAIRIPKKNMSLHLRGKILTIKTSQASCIYLRN